MVKPASGAPRHLAAGIYRATVTRIDHGRYWVIARDLLGDQELGGVNGFEALDAAGFATNDVGPHTHDSIGVGDRVLVASVAGRATDLVVLGKLTP